MPIQFTRKGRYEVWRGGQKISEHNQEREATEQIINHSSVYGDGDYEIKGYLVVARVVGSVNPQTGDTTPPTTPGSVSASATSATTGTVTWTASTDASGVAGYQIFLDGAPLSPTTTNLSYSLTGLSPSTQYAVTVVAFDAAGNNSVAGGPALFTTDANSAPVWSLGNQAYETGASVSISLDTVCTDADGDTITYSLVSGSLPSGLSLSGARNETLSGTVDTVEVASFTLGASDGIASAQNVALTFTITAPDTVAPAAPTGLSVVSTTSSGINLDWADNAESDLASYDVYRSTVGASGPWGKRNGTPLTSSNYQDSGLNELTQYWYYVTATDNSSNESSASPVVSSTTSAGGGVPYDLGSVRFAYSWPTEPNITSTVNVSTAAQLSSELASGTGKRIVVAAGTYDGTFTVGQNDTWIDMQPGAVIGPSGAGPSLYFNASRMKVTGGTLNGGWWGNTGWSDILIDGTDFVDQNLNGDNINIRAGQRMAILNLSIDLRFFAFMTLDSSGTTFIDDLIMANVEIEAGASGDRRAPLRLNGVRRGVFRDMRIVSNTSYHMLRLESFNSYHDWKNIQFEGTGTQGINFSTAIPEGGSGTISNIWFENVNVYANSAQFRHFPDSSLISNVTMLNNTWYTNGKTPNDPWVPAPDDFVVPSGSTYTNTTYQPYQSPPAWP